MCRVNHKQHGQLNLLIGKENHKRRDAAKKSGINNAFVLS
jgi:hypothetical protein